MALVILFFQVKVFAEESATNSEFDVLSEDTPVNEPPFEKSEEQKQFEESSEPEKLAEAPLPAKPMASPLVVREGSKKIQHPNASKGLYLIDRTTGTYYYKTKVESQQDTSISMRFGQYDTPDISSTINGTKIKFTDVYPSELVMLMVDYEWQPFKSFGKLGVQLGTGILVAQGNGFLTTRTPPTGCTVPCPAKEEYTFLAIPLNAGLVYRFEYVERQWLAPFIAAGGTYYGLAEIRDDGQDNRFVGSPGAYGAGGAMLNISALDKETGFIFDREYGISNLWLTLEFRAVQSISDSLDMSSNTLSAGVTVDF